jgi:hypothetical protein
MRPLRIRSKPNGVRSTVVLVPVRISSAIDAPTAGAVDPALVKTGQAIPVFYDAGFDGKDFFVPDAVKGLPILTFHELYIKGTMPSGQFWD